MKKLILIFSLLLISIGAIALLMYIRVYAPNVELNESPSYIYITADHTYNDVLNEINNANFLVNKKSFEWTANRMKLPELYKAGKYEIKDGMSNRELVNMFRLGDQVTVKYLLKSFTRIGQIAFSASTSLEPDSLDFIKKLTDRDYLNELGYDTHTVMSMFIPNTYYFKWNTTPDAFIERMKVENEKFWDENKTQKAKEMGFSKLQVITLASIVEKETYMADEKATVAGVYINRFNRGMRLQADPTLIFALKDYEIRRVLNKHKKVDSPYNTYLYAGLPPGPICSPSISSINSVLNYENHNFLYFCAKEDFSGYHNFAKTYSQHIKNARKFQRELDKRNIRS